MTNSRALVLVATAQLAGQVVGLTVAARRGLPYDVRVVGMRGQADEIGRDAWDKGTALSAPVTMLGTQAAAIVLAATGAGSAAGIAAKALGALGALNIGGYLGERVVRERLRPGGWGPGRDTGGGPEPGACSRDGCPRAGQGRQTARSTWMSLDPAVKFLARLAGSGAALELEQWVAGWDESPFTSENSSHVSVWCKSR